MKLVFAWVFIHVPSQSNTMKSCLLSLALLHLWSRGSEKIGDVFFGWQGSSRCFQMLAFSLSPSSADSSIIHPSLMDGLLSERLLTPAGFLFLPIFGKSTLKPNSYCLIQKLHFLYMVAVSSIFPPNVYGGLRSILEGVSIGLGMHLHTKSL